MMTSLSQLTIELSSLTLKNFNLEINVKLVLLGGFLWPVKSGKTLLMLW